MKIHQMLVMSALIVANALPVRASMIPAPGHCAAEMLNTIAGDSQAGFCSPLESAGSMVLDAIFVTAGPPLVVGSILAGAPRAMVMAPLLTASGAVGLGFDAAATVPNAFLRYVWPRSKRRS